MNRFARSGIALLYSPVLWGCVAAVGFYTLHHGGVIGGDTVDRYFAGHPVNYIETVTFFVGLAALVIKALDLAGQWQTLDQVRLAPVPEGGNEADDAPQLLQALDQLPPAAGQGLLARRVRGGLEFVRRHQSAAGLEGELKDLADQDSAAAAASYALLRIVVWAIPILGFLGTVIGITMAIAELSPEALEKSLPQVTHGLGVAFDTTALALALSMVLMFLQHACDRWERQLLAAVDRRTMEELGGRFVPFGPGGAPQVAEVRRIAEIVLESSEQAVLRQAQLWQNSIETAQAHWQQATRQSQSQLEAALGGALAQTLEAHAAAVARAQRESDECNRRHWGEVQQALSQLAQAMTHQQRELVRQGEVLLSVVEATGQVAQLETTLNRNLSALSGTQQFEETLHSLAAAIHLLTARLGQSAGPVARVVAPRLPENQAA